MPGNNDDHEQQKTADGDPGRPGLRVGEWVLDRPVGGGAFGRVWRATHHAWADQVAAVKLPTDPAYVRALRREGRFAGRLEHPNVVRPIGFDPFAETPYLVMEYVPGSDLRRRVSRGPMKADEAVAVLKQVLAGLAYAHGKGLVHRDVKPENVLVHERAAADPQGLAAEGVVKVTDFGLGRAEQAVAQKGGGTQSIVFSTDLGDAGGSLAGSLDYMAPEQRGGGDVDGRADLYACGVMLFEMLTGERPAGTDVPSDLNPGVPPHLDDAFRAAYARLEKRVATAAELAALLDAPAAPAPRPKPRPSVVAASVTASAGACPSCGGRHEAGDQFCMQCGKQLVELVRRCGKCGAFPAPQDNFCMFCGHALVPARPA